MRLKREATRLGGRLKMKFTSVRTLLGAIALLVVVAGCGAYPASDKVVPTNTPQGQLVGTYRTLTMEGFADILANGKGQYKVINVHTPYEGEIEGTDAKIPYNDVDALTAALPDKNAPIILYCRSGRMSELASRALLAKGYTQVWDVPGGMIAWEASGRKVVDK